MHPFAATMTNSVLLCLTYSQLVKLHSGNVTHKGKTLSVNNKSYTAGCHFKIKTEQLVDETTGEPSLANLDEFVKEAADPLDNSKVRFHYSYSDRDDNRVLITTSNALNAALKDCLDDADLKLRVTVAPKVTLLWLVCDEKGTRF